MADKWYIGAQNDLLFIINTPPRPAGSEPWHDRPDGPSLAILVDKLDKERIQEIVDAHNAAVNGSTLRDKLWELRQHAANQACDSSIGLAARIAETAYAWLGDNIEAFLDSPMEGTDLVVCWPTPKHIPFEGGSMLNPLRVSALAAAMQQELTLGEQIGVAEALAIVEFLGTPLDATRRPVVALGKLLEACEEDCGTAAGNYGDDGPVGASLERPRALTFAILREARAAYDEVMSDAEPVPTEERTDYVSDAQARELFGTEACDALPTGRVRVCDGEWVKIPGGYYFDKSAGPLHPEVTAG